MLFYKTNQGSRQGSDNSFGLYSSLSEERESEREREGEAVEGESSGSCSLGTKLKKTDWNGEGSELPELVQ